MVKYVKHDLPTGEVAIINGEESVSIEKIARLIELEIKRETGVLEYISKRAKQLAPGSLSINAVKNDRYYQQATYLHGKKVRINLDPLKDSDREIIRELMEKKAIVHGRPILKGNITALRQCLSRIRPYDPASFRYGKYLGSEYYLEGDVCLSEWEERKSSQNFYYEEGLIHGTRSGVRVRSKSEVMIADALYDNGIKFKTEPALEVGEKIVYPDFEIVHPKAHKLIWWEHFGMMDDPEYAYNAMKKLTEYERSGIVFGENLIVTYETAMVPLTHEMINERMRHHGLIGF